jgi:hypothetical protein
MHGHCDLLGPTADCLIYTEILRAKRCPLIGKPIGWMAIYPTFTGCPEEPKDHAQIKNWYSPIPPQEDAP